MLLADEIIGKSQFMKKIVQGLKQYSEEAGDLFVAHFSPLIRRRLVRLTQQEDVDDLIADTLIATIEANRKGALKTPEALAGYVMTITTRKAAQWVQEIALRRNRHVVLDEVPNTFHYFRSSHPNPEELAIQQHKVDVMARALKRLSLTKREILVRFYLKEESMEQIMLEMELTNTQFRLLKSRAKSELSTSVTNFERSLQRFNREAA